MKKFVVFMLLIMLAGNISAQKVEIKKIVVKGVAIEMVKVKGGNYVMGCTFEQGKCGGDEYPAHQVTLNDFYLAKFEVTQELWKAVMGESIEQHRDKISPNRRLCGKGNNYPMYYISWYDCVEFIEKLNAITGSKFRMPTEAEWEYAARGGVLSDSIRTRFSGGNDADILGWHLNNANSTSHPVGQKAPNTIGLYDMTGNVWEWCSDWYDVYDDTPETNPQGPEKSGLGKVLRGGSWFNEPAYCRVARRMFRVPENRGSSFGLRLAM